MSSAPAPLVDNLLDLVRPFGMDAQCHVGHRLQLGIDTPPSECQHGSMDSNSALICHHPRTMWNGHLYTTIPNAIVGRSIRQSIWASVVHIRVVLYGLSEHFRY